MDVGHLMTVTEAAAEIGRSPVYVRALIAKTGGKGPPFRGVKLGPLWMVYRDDVAAFSPRPAGRPRKADLPPAAPSGTPRKAAAEKPKQRPTRKPAKRAKASKRSR
jgi:hypothetical protein